MVVRGGERESVEEQSWGAAQQEGDSSSPREGARIWDGCRNFRKLLPKIRSLDGGLRRVVRLRRAASAGRRNVRGSKGLERHCWGAVS
jgi:hypothetical protein